MKVELNQKEVFELQAILKDYQESLKNLIDSEENVEDKKSLLSEFTLVSRIIEKLNK